MKKYEVLVIDDEADMQETLKSILKKKYIPTAVSSGTQGLKKIESNSYSTVLLDLRMPGLDGVETLKKIKEIDKDLPVIIVTASKDLKSAVESMKLGAFEFITKPFEVDELLAVVEKALEVRLLRIENQYLRESLEESHMYCDLIGKTPKMKKIMELIDTIAPTDSTILIFGESGTGKEIVAKAIHKMSKRKNHPFIAINCAAIPENLLESELFGHERGAFTGALERKLGKFELADNGTIFLDEIGCMSSSMQSKLLRILEDRVIERVGGTKPLKVNVRIISATNIDFQKAIKEGKFREDLYFRLNVIPINLPPLRERKEDLSLFIAYFLEKYNKLLNKNIKGLSPQTMAQLKNYSFPGNVRELQNLIERAAALCKKDEIEFQDMFFSLDKNQEVCSGEFDTLKEACENFEKEYIKTSLEKNRSNQTKTAKTLGIARTTLNSRLEALGLR